MHPELCDGIVNNCGSELSTDEIDQDGDGLGCEIDNGGWDGVSRILEEMIVMIMMSP